MSGGVDGGQRPPSIVPDPVRFVGDYVPPIYWFKPWAPPPRPKWARRRALLLSPLIILAIAGGLAFMAFTIAAAATADRLKEIRHGG